jgi:hypothetical protein
MARSYESAKRAVEGEALETFTLDGAEFTPVGNVHLLDLCELARNADADVESPTGIAAMGDFFEGLLGEAEYKRFRAHCRKHHTESETLFLIMNDIIKEVTGRPTMRSESSASGLSTTSTTAKVVSFQGRTVLDLEPSTGEAPDLPLDLLERIRRDREAREAS